MIRAWEEGTGLTMYDGYGQTETTVLVANYRAVPVRPGSMGKPMPGYTVDVLDEDGQRAADDVVGNIAVSLRAQRPVGLFDEYYRDPEATRRVRFATAGTTPATRRGATPTATCGSRAATTT